MELNNNEVQALEVAEKAATDARISQLNDLQLAMVGGGIGETTL